MLTTAEQTPVKIYRAFQPYMRVLLYFTSDIFSTQRRPYLAMGAK